MRLKRVLVAAAVVAVAVSQAAAAPAAPRVLAESRFEIREVAQDRGRIAWVVERPNPKAEAPWDPACSVLVARRFAGARALVLRRTCARTISNVQLAGGRAAWYESHHGDEGSRYTVYWTIRTAPIATASVRTIARFSRDERELSNDETSLSGDGGTLAYGWKSWHDANGCNLMFEPDCVPDVSMSGGGVRRIVGSRAVDVPTVGPSSQIDAASGRIARVDAGLLEIVDAATGAALSTLSFDDHVVDVALSRTTVAVMLRARGSELHRTEVYDLRTGALAHAVGRATWYLDVEGARVVFPDRGGIRIADGTGAARRVWWGAAHAVSLDADRLVWVEDGRRDRVLSLKLGR